MPEMHFTLRWPDSSITQNYSPSSVITEFFTAGNSYELPIFLQLSRTALQKASDRVREKYGFGCARAGATLAAIERKAEIFSQTPNAAVTILELG